MALSLPHTPFIVPLFIPHAGCPHQCVFCNQTPTTGTSAGLPDTFELHQTIQRFLDYRRDHQRPTEISFFGGNFLGLPEPAILRLLEAVTPYVDQGMVRGIRFSTRPDTIDEQRLALIAPYPVTTVELGVQSMNDQVLETSRRGHSSRHVDSAVTHLKQAAYAVGLQMMIGLPQDTPERAMDSAARMAALNPDFVRIYPTLVIEGSPLAQWYRQGRYRPWSLEIAVQVAGQLCVLFQRNAIPVARLGLQPTDALNTDGAVLAGPFHPAFGELVYSELWFECIRTVLRSQEQPTDVLFLGVHPRCVSQVRGNRNRSVERLKAQFRMGDVRVSSDPDLPPDHISINGSRHRWY